MLGLTVRKKRIYIIVIISSLSLLAAVWIFGRTQTPTLPPSLTTPTQTLVSPKGPAGQVVFPSDNKFDLSVFESTTFKTLKVYTPLSVDSSELGREDPFKPY